MTELENLTSLLKSPIQTDKQTKNPQPKLGQIRSS